MSRFRWTRAAYKQAAHLDRLIPHLPYYVRKPELVNRYHELWAAYTLKHQPDPMRLQLQHRLERYRGDEIPF